VVNPASVGALVSDREFISAAWLRRLHAESIPFAIRLRSDRRIARWPGASASGASSSGASALPARLFARPILTTEERVLHRVRPNEDSPEDDSSEGDLSETNSCRSLQPVDVAMKRTHLPGTSDPFVILAVWKTDPSHAIDLYRRRWSIETLFAALKPHGFDLEQTHLTAPGHIKRLIGFVALAFVWARLVGEPPTQFKGPPRRKNHVRRQRSRFRYVLDRLQRILTTPRLQPTAFFECLRLLRSPTVFLSCS
jgi:hypothetical protein